MQFIKHLKISRACVCGSVLVAVLFVSAPLHGGEQSSGTITTVDVAQRIVEIGGIRYKLAQQSESYTGLIVPRR